MARWLYYRDGTEFVRENWDAESDAFKNGYRRDAAEALHVSRGDPHLTSTEQAAARRGHGEPTNRLVAVWSDEGLVVTFEPLDSASGGACPYAEMDWTCCKQAGHDGPHESAPR